MSTALRWPIVLTLIAAVGTTACVLRGPADVRREITRSTGIAYEREFGLTLGRVGTAIARWSVRTAHDPDVADISLAGVRKVQIGIYRPADVLDDDRGRFDPDRLGSWQRIVSVREDGEDVLVLVREREGTIREMLVVVSEHDELVIVRIKGKLDRIIDDSLRYGLAQAGRDELYGPVTKQLQASAEDPAL